MDLSGQDLLSGTYIGSPFVQVTLLLRAADSEALMAGREPGRNWAWLGQEEIDLKRFHPPSTLLLHWLICFAHFHSHLFTVVLTVTTVKSCQPVTHFLGDEILPLFP
jgi:hypothetical protein